MRRHCDADRILDGPCFGLPEDQRACFDLEFVPAFRALQPAFLILGTIASVRIRRRHRRDSAGLMASFACDGLPRCTRRNDGGRAGKPALRPCGNDATCGGDGRQTGDRVDGHGNLSASRVLMSVPGGAGASHAYGDERLVCGGREAFPMTGQSGRPFLGCAAHPVMAALPSGSLDMSSPRPERGRDDDEGP